MLDLQISGESRKFIQGEECTPIQPLVVNTPLSQSPDSYQCGQTTKHQMTSSVSEFMPT